MDKDNIFVRIANYAEFASVVNGSIKDYPCITFYSVREVIEHLRGCVKYLIERGTDLNEEYGYQVPLSDTHEKVYWFKLVDYTKNGDYLNIELYYNGTLK
jgi:hypothetical protein